MVDLLPPHIFGEHTAALTPSPEGQVCCGDARGPEAVHCELLRRQAGALWRSVHSALASGGPSDRGFAVLAEAAVTGAAGRGTPGGGTEQPLPLPVFEACVLDSLRRVAAQSQLAGTVGAALRRAVARRGARACLDARRGLRVAHEEEGKDGDPLVFQVCLEGREGSMAVSERGLLLEGPLWPSELRGRRHVGETELRAILQHL